ncbi:collagen alpha-1(I) chain-like [Nannospalax galili]|uniref:collagen alpha-1(I) chain-like n=1 Tax=Nannospalax galili TaxID=1026970 RepID=UPI00111C859A|nr:collagen alpha-1(I) chain-like [Nannospalax galili]
MQKQPRSGSGGIRRPRSAAFAQIEEHRTSGRSTVWTKNNNNNEKWRGGERRGAKPRRGGAERTRGAGRTPGRQGAEASRARPGRALRGPVGFWGWKAAAHTWGSPAGSPRRRSGPRRAERRSGRELFLQRQREGDTGRESAALPPSVPPSLAQPRRARARPARARPARRSRRAERFQMWRGGAPGADQSPTSAPAAAPPDQPLAGTAAGELVQASGHERRRGSPGFEAPGSPVAPRIGLQTPAFLLLGPQGPSRPRCVSGIPRTRNTICPTPSLFKIE